MTEAKALNWDSIITIGGTTLEPGEAHFVVTKGEKDYYDGGDKIPACPSYHLTLRVTDAKGNVDTVNDTLYLATNMQWKIEHFGKATGLVAPDTPNGAGVRIPWDRIVGTSGTCEIKVTVSGGRSYNDVDDYLVPDTGTDAGDSED